MSAQSEQPGAATLASEYAEALLDLAVQAGQTDLVEQELAGLVDLLGLVPDLDEFLATPLIPPERKAAVMERAVGGAACPLTCDFLGVLVLHGRGGLLPAVRKAYRHLLHMRQEMVEVVATTAVEAGPEVRDRLLAGLREFLGAEPLLEMRVNPNLLGGLRLRVGDRVIDASVRSSLDRMRRELSRGVRTA